MTKMLYCAVFNVSADICGLPPKSIHPLLQAVSPALCVCVCVCVCLCEREACV